MKWLAICIPAALASSPAISAPKDDVAAAIATLRSQDDAILRIGERLIVHGRPLCRDAGYSAGMTVQLRAQYGAAYRAAATAAIGVSDYPTITAIAAGSAAATAGLRVGDWITAVDDRPFEPVPPTRADGTFTPTSLVLDIIESASADGAVRLAIQRQGQRLGVTVALKSACRARFDVRAGSASNASSDGVNIQVSSDLVAEAGDDEELAAILAHELVHNILRHPQRLKGPPPRPSVKRTEIEADRLSVYLLDAAGYTSAGAERFWGRWGRARDLGILANGSHPGWKQRIAIIRTESARIAALKASGLAVTVPPELAAP